MSFPPLAALLPHRAPMLWLDEVISQRDQEVHCRLTLRHEHLFVVAGEVEPLLAVEWMAQSVAALMGLIERSGGSPRPGYLVAIPEASFHVVSFRVGDVLELRAQKTGGDASYAWFEAQVERAGVLAASAQLRVYVQKPAQVGS